MKKVFDNSVRHFWPANQSQIYQACMSRARQAGDPRVLFLSMLTLDYGLKSSQAMLDWLD